MSTLGDTPKALPIYDLTKVATYSLKDLIKPGSQDALLSALPLYQVLLISFVFIVWLIVFLYFWKLVYYLVDDPYATPEGDAPPNKRSLDQATSDRILRYIYSKPQQATKTIKYVGQAFQNS